MKFLVEITPGVDAPVLQEQLDSFLLLLLHDRDVSVTALAESHVVVDVDQLVRLQEKVCHVA